MKKGTFLLLLMLLAFGGKLQAQFVTIPDNTFANWLRTNGYSSCLVGNQLDTTCPAVINTTTISCWGVGIDSLEGIQYFDNLDTLICGGNSLTALPRLPRGLTHLECGANYITALDDLPLGLVRLDFTSNRLTSWPQLEYHYDLVYLRASDNLLTNTPPYLPSGIEYFYCNNNRITTISYLPQGLREFYCFENLITTIPIQLPQYLEVFDASYNYLTEIPELPASVFWTTGLTYMDLKNNLIDTLPSTWPPFLNRLDLSYNRITNTPINLPANLSHLNIRNNQITSFPVVNNGLRTLYVDYNNFNTIPGPLPFYLDTFSCAGLGLDSLPQIIGARYLDCGYNNLSEIRVFYNNVWMNYLDCSHNNISYLPVRVSKTLLCNDNPTLTCLPELPHFSINNPMLRLNFTNTAVNCLPNYGIVNVSTPPQQSLPLCDVINPNNCPPLWNIQGTVFTDDNSNCVRNPGESAFRNVKINVFQGGVLKQQAFTIDSGLYSIDLNGVAGTYITSIDTSDLPFVVTCPPSGNQSSVITAVNLFYTGKNFAMECKTGYDIGTLTSFCENVFRPARVAKVNFRTGDLSNIYYADCAAGISGQVRIVYSGPITYTGSAAGALSPTNISGDTVTWNIVDFNTTDIYSSFSLFFTTDTFAQIGDSACFEILVTSSIAGDYDLSNNTYYRCFPIVNSYDPNNKEVVPAVVNDDSEWLYYTINFQNLGTAPAEHIVVRDTLDGDLDASTFQLLAYSHDNITQVFNGGIVNFNFPEINLIDSLTDEPGSHGFVQYRIKLKPNMPWGTIIENTAHIYFDFNPAVVTNTTQNALLPLPVPAPTVTASTQTTCAGDTITIQTTLNPIYTAYQWFKNGDSITNANNAVLLVFEPGTYTLRATDGFSSAVSNPIAITFQSPAVSLFAASNTVCVDGSVVPLSVSPAGGNLNGTGISGNGFNAANAGVGPHILVYSYTDTNGCTNSDTTTITVSAKPNVTLTPTSNAVCEDAPAVTLTAGPQGGTYSGAVVSGNSFNPSANALGVNNIQYEFTDANGCSDVATTSITVNAKPNATLTPASNAICEDAPAVTLTASPASGTYSGAVISGNSFNPSANNLGINTIQYEYTDSNGCSDVATASITVNANPTASLTPASNAVCEDAPAVILTANPQGGTYSGAVVSGNSFDPSANTVGVNSIQYEYTDSNGCADIATTSITVNANPTASLTPASNAVCEDAPAVILTPNPQGGTYSGAVVSGNSFDPSDNTVGVNNIQYEYTDANGCSDVASASITINAKPNATLTPASNTVCENASAIAIAIAPTGGTLTGNGISGNSFSPSNGPGQFVLTYNYTDANGCSDIETANIAVNALPTPSIALPTSPFCKADGLEALADYVNLAGGTFSGDVVASNGDFDLSAVGSYAIEYTYADANGCEATAQATVVIDECIGITSIAGPAISVYPNPASSHVVVVADVTLIGSTISLVSIDGKVLMKEIAQGKTHTLSTADIAPGIYFITLQSRSLTSRTRVAIVR